MSNKGCDMAVVKGLEYLLVMCFLLGFAICQGQGSEGGFPFENRKKFLDFILAAESFKINVPPNYDTDEPTIIECRVHVENFDTISEADMDFTVTLLLHLSWLDHRLSQYNIMNMKEGYVEIDSKALDRFWVPDLYFPNEKNAYYHNVLMPNKVLRIYNSMEVSFSTRLSLTLSCKMDFRRYPFDVQKCRIETESFSYNDGDIVLQWTNETKAVQLDSNDLPQFKIINVSTFATTNKRKGQGNHSAISLEFTFSRNIGYYLVQMYIPSALVVVLSWISFWLNVNAVPGRISLGVLTVLTMTTQSSAVNASLPHVSYTKAIDIWMSTCLMFVFFALIEFAVANVLMRKDTSIEVTLKKLLHIPVKKKEKIIDDYSRERDTERGEGTSAGKKKTVRSGVRYAMYCDVSSRFVFPSLFVLFNIAYWSYYMGTDALDIHASL